MRRERKGLMQREKRGSKAMARVCSYGLIFFFFGGGGEWVEARWFRIRQRGP